MDFLQGFRKEETGSMFTAVLGVVAVVGVLSVSVYGLISGPVRTAATVTAKSKAINNMILTSKILLSAASDTPTIGDEDGIPELPPFIADPIFPSGGILPTNLGVDLMDPWGTPYAYCTWDHGPIRQSAGRLDGLNHDINDIEGKYVVAVISAGPNRSFEIECSDMNDLSDTGIDETANIDDLIEKYTIGQAAGLVGGAGESVWEVLSPDEIRYQNRVGIGTSPDADPNVQLSVGGNLNLAGDLSASGFSGVFTNLTASRLNVDGSVAGGALDGTPIGATTPSTGRFTTISTENNGALVHDIYGTTNLRTLNVLNGGGMINFTAIGGSSMSPTPSTGRFTGVWATGLSMPDFGHVADIHTANLNTLTVVNTGMVTNLTANYLGAVGQDAAFFRDASNLNAGTIDPDRLPNFTGDVGVSRTDATTAATRVDRIKGRPVSGNAPNADDVLAWNGTTWIPTPIGDGGIGITETDPTVNSIAKTSVWSSNCALGQIPKSTGPNTWECAVDAGGFANPATANLNMNGYKIINVSAVQMTSDFRLKKDIKPMSSILKRLEQIEPVSFYWNDFAKKKGYDADKHLGLIAQDVEAIFPEAIITNEEGVKGIDYSSLSAVMLQAIRELSEQNKMLQGQINDLKRQQKQ